MPISAYAAAAAGICSGLCISLSACAQTYPAQPIKMIVPFAPGGGADLIARIISPHLTESLGQQLIIENKAGANTIIGAELAAKARPDGYTLLLAVTATLAINPSLYEKLPYDPIRGFTPITLVSIGPNVLVAHPSIPVKTVKELIALARSQPGKLTYGSSGVGGASHLAGELFKSMAGVDIVHIPYKGAAPATTELLAGHVSLTFVGTGAAMPYMKSGKLRGIAVGSLNRSRMIPDLPTISETLSGFEAVAWFGVLAPAGLPSEITRRLNAAIIKTVNRDDVTNQIMAQGYEPLTNTPEEFAGYIKLELVKWSKVVKESGARPEQ